VAKPTGCCWSRPDHELEFLQPLPVADWGRWRGDRRQTHNARHRETVADVAELGEPMLASLSAGAMVSLYALSRNVDARRVQTVWPASVGRNAHWAALPRFRGNRRRPWSRSSTDHPAACAQPEEPAGPLVLRMRFDDFGARRDRTPFSGPRRHRTATGRRTADWSPPQPAHRRARPDNDRVSASEHRPCGAQQLELPFEASADPSPSNAAVAGCEGRYGNTALTRACFCTENAGIEIAASAGLETD